MNWRNRSGLSGDGNMESRNDEIYRRWKSGEEAGVLSEHYNLTKERILQIVRQVRQSPLNEIDNVIENIEEELRVLRQAKAMIERGEK